MAPHGDQWRSPLQEMLICSYPITTDISSPKMLSHFIFLMPFLQYLLKVKVNCQIYAMIFKSLCNTFLLKVKVVKYNAL